MTIRAKLISLILLITIPSVGLMGLFSSHILALYQIQSSLNQQHTLRMITAEMKNLFDAAKNRLRDISREDVLFSSKPGCSDFLNSTIEDFGEFSNLVVLDKKGIVLCASDGFENLKEITFVYSFQQALQIDGKYFSNLADGDATGLQGLQVAYPLNYQSGSFERIILGTINPDWLNSAVNSYEYPPGVNIHIADQSGKVLYTRYPENQPVGTLIKDENLLQSFHRAILQDEVAVINSDKVERVYKFTPLDPQRKILVGIGIPDNSFIDDSITILVGNIAFLLLITLASVIVVIRGFENAIVKPLNTISRKADQLSAGNFSVRTGMSDRNDEIGQLSQNFDRLALSLEEQKANLEYESSSNLANQEKYFRLFEDSILGIVKVSPLGDLLDANPAMARMLGYSSSEELLENVKKMREILLSEDSLMKRLEELVSNRQQIRVEMNYIKKDGKTFPGNLFIWGVWNASGDLEGLEGFVEDTSLVKQTRTALKKLGKAVEQNPIGIIITDGEGSIEYANPAVEDEFGLKPEEIVGSLIKVLLPEELAPGFLEEITRNVKNGISQQGEIKHSRKNGEEFWAAYKVSPIVDETGVTRNSLIMVEDITHRHFNQERLSALRTIDLAISSNMDISTILNIIVHLAEKQLGVHAVCIQKYDAHFHMLRTLSQVGMSQTQSKNIPFPASADLNEREILQDFSIYIPENLGKQQASHHIPFPEGETFDACFGLPLVAKSKILGVIRVFSVKNLVPEQHWMDFFYDLAAQTALALENHELLSSLLQSRKDVLEAYNATIAGWSKALEFRDEPTEKHSENTTNWTIAIAREMGFSDEELEHVWRGAKLHDIGKFNVPDRILRKKGPLDSKERKLINEHPAAAYNMLKDIQFLQPALDIPYCHHERWDGTGYPRGLKGNEIPLAARIFSVVDVFDAMIQDRPYRDALPFEMVINHLREESGKQFDPEVVETFLSLLAKQRALN